MEGFRHFPGVTTLALDSAVCIGCGICTHVCPHGVMALNGKRAEIADKDGCMECGACARNCPSGALAVTPGVGCAAYIVQTWLKAKNIPVDAKCC
ncbi:MAG: mercury methylation ferredoxin HgcB [Desulfosalsimonadaceae bacterium]